MLRTRFTDMFGISVPVLLAPFGPWEQTRLAAEVCRPGALGSLGTVERLETAPETVDPAEVGPEMLRAVRAGRGHELLPFTGQSAQLVHDVLPAQEVVARLVADAERALDRAVAAVRR
jgi:NAD(P)H-dependent flavin oxidoreductase YrpB (nitropropane dioxygenase family)